MCVYCLPASVSHEISTSSLVLFPYGAKKISLLLQILGGPLKNYHFIQLIALYSHIYM